MITSMKLGLVGLLLGTLSYADNFPNTYNVSSQVSDVHHGIKEDKYLVDAKLAIKNKGNKQINDNRYAYSVCFDVPKGAEESCITGGGGSLSLNPGETFNREIHMSAPNYSQSDLRGKKTKVTFMLLENELRDYVAFHPLGKVGDYK